MGTQEELTLPPLRRMRSVLVLLVLASSTLAFGPCQPYGFGLPSFHFRAPLLGQLSEVGPLEFVLRVPAFGGVEDLRISVDEEPLDPESWDRGHREVRGPLEGLQDGKHHLRAELDLRIAFLFQIQLEAATWFDLAELENAELAPRLVDDDEARRACQDLYSPIIHRGLFRELAGVMSPDRHKN